MSVCFKVVSGSTKFHPYSDTFHIDFRYISYIFQIHFILISYWFHIDFISCTGLYCQNPYIIYILYWFSYHSFSLNDSLLLSCTGLYCPNLFIFYIVYWFSYHSFSLIPYWFHILYWVVLSKSIYILYCVLCTD